MRSCAWFIFTPANRTKHPWMSCNFGFKLHKQSLPSVPLTDFNFTFWIFDLIWYPSSITNRLHYLHRNLCPSLFHLTVLTSFGFTVSFTDFPYESQIAKANDCGNSKIFIRFSESSDLCHIRNRKNFFVYFMNCHISNFLLLLIPYWFLVRKECILSPSISDKSGFLSRTASIHFEMAVPPMFQFRNFWYALIVGRRINRWYILLHIPNTVQICGIFTYHCRFAPFGKIRSLFCQLTLQSQFNLLICHLFVKCQFRSSCRHFLYAAPLNTAPKSQLEQRWEPNRISSNKIR